MRIRLSTLRSYLINKLSVVWIIYLLIFLSVIWIFYTEFEFFISHPYFEQKILYNFNRLVFEEKYLINSPLLSAGYDHNFLYFMFNENYHRFFNYSLVVIFIILVMLVIFTIWGFYLVKNILNLVANPIDALIKNISNIQQSKSYKINTESSIIEVNKLIVTISQMLVQQFSIEKKIKHDKKVLTYLAYYDTDIHAHNYHYLLKNIRNISQQISSSSEKILLLVLFKIINLDNIENILGKKKTDDILINFTKFISKIFRVKGNVARVNHTDFVLYIVKEEQLTTEEFLESYDLNSLRLQQFVSEINLEFSVGVASFPNQAKTINQLLAYARFAAVKATKVEDRGVKFFDLKGEKELIKIAELEKDLYSAVAKKQIFLLFQPQIDLRTNKIVGCEALVRWNHPRYGIVPPLDFISIAEKNLEIIKIGRCIQEKAISLYSKWVKLNNNKFKIAINASLIEINTQAYPYYLLNLAKRYNVPPSAIEIEITESVADDNFGLFNLNIKRIRSLGFQVAIDDFGTGYSSLERLQKLKVDILKIDRVFLTNNFHKYNSIELLKVIFALGNVFKTECLIEGVETEFEANYSKELGIQYAQGFFFYPPLTEEAMTDLLKKG